MEAQRGRWWVFDFWMFVKTVATECWGIYGSAFTISVTKHIIWIIRVFVMAIIDVIRVDVAAFVPRMIFCVESVARCVETREKIVHLKDIDFPTS